MVIKRNIKIEGEYTNMRSVDEKLELIEYFQRKNNISIDSILNMMEFNVDKINDYLGELRSSILK